MNPPSKEMLEFMELPEMKKLYSAFSKELLRKLNLEQGTKILNERIASCDREMAVLGTVLTRKYNEYFKIEEAAQNA